MNARRSVLGFAILFAVTPAGAAESDWPPTLKGSTNGTVTFTTPAFLDVPEGVKEEAAREGAAPYVVAKTPPTVTLAYHGNLGPDAKGRRLWSSWGDICVARDGRVYCAIGDHGQDVQGDARCFVYRWDPAKKVLERVVDMNAVVPPEADRPSWSKVHAKLDEGTDGKIYFSCTLNDGNRAKACTWTDAVPGGQLYAHDPSTGKTEVVANLPAKRCTATSLYDAKRNIWWCNLEAGEGNALWGLDLGTRKPAFQAADGSLGFNRAVALGADGSVYFNGPDDARTLPKPADPKTPPAKKPAAPTKAEQAAALEKTTSPIWKFDPATRALRKTGSAFAGTPGMRSATPEAGDGNIYGSTQARNELFRYSVRDDKLTTLGPVWLTGAYVTVMVRSPDGRFLYYLPGAHGGAFKHGTPVVQYDIARKSQKVLAFLAPAFEKEYGYVPGGTYGAKLSADGGTLYVNFNGHAADPAVRPAGRKADGFGLTAFAAITIPATER
ncbi:MAG: hypothetical protein K8U57_12060 [Planctomycetes bacterium]|nr:hypothetical protein [Planctomycetota bacterium]